MNIENVKYNHFLGLWAIAGVIGTIYGLSADPHNAHLTLTVGRDLWLFALAVGTATFLLLQVMELLDPVVTWVGSLRTKEKKVNTVEAPASEQSAL